MIFFRSSILVLRSHGTFSITALRSAKDLERKEDDRDSLVKCWREKYKDNPRLEDCINNTGIMSEYMDINVAIEKFEKQIDEIRKNVVGQV